MSRVAFTQILRDARLAVSASHDTGMHIGCCWWGQLADIATSESVSSRCSACSPSSLGVALSFAQSAPAALLLGYLPALNLRSRALVRVQVRGCVGAYMSP